MRHTLLALVVAVSTTGCGGDDGPPPVLDPSDPADVRQTLEDLAAFGEKRVGTVDGARAGDYVADRMRELGLQDVGFESFRVPMWNLESSQMSLAIDGQAVTGIEHDVFYASGTGTADADVVYVNTAEDNDLANIDITGKIALVRRSVSFHRSSQMRNVSEAGAAAMLYMSTAPDNLRQVGTVSLSWESMVAIPGITIGADDGATLRAALDDGQTVTATINVAASVGQGEGRNVVGRIAGNKSEQILVGAHYDTWFTGSADNGSGTAALLALADRMVRSGKPEYTLVFIAYDGEEVALYGGYDYLRKHHYITRDPIIAVVNFEMPSVANGTLVGLGRSTQAALEDGLRYAGLNFLYPFFVTLEVVPELFGGVIPTDIQGMYRAGIPTVTTATDSPYYHTTADTPDNVDSVFLAESVDAFDEALDAYMAEPPDAFDEVDTNLWLAEASAGARSAGQSLMISVTVTDAAGVAVADAEVNADLLYDDFSFGGSLTATTDANGDATITFDAAVADLGAGDRFVHVTSGREWPLVETIVVLE
jgi:aminopeptidase YwaD